MSILKKWTMLIAFFIVITGCGIPGISGDKDKTDDEKVINIYEGNSIKLSHTVDGDGKILSSRIYSKYGLIEKAYSYDAGDNLTQIDKVNPLGQKSTIRISEDKDLTRSGKVSKVIKRYQEDSPARSGSVERTLVYEYEYNDDGELDYIKKDFGNNNIEVKLSDKLSKEVAYKINTTAGSRSGTIPTKTSGTMPDWAANYDMENLSTSLQNIELDIMGDVVDFREDGIRENIVDGETVTRSITDMTEGMIFIGSDEVSRKIYKIEQNGNTYTYRTVKPDFYETFAGITIPPQTIWVTDESNVVTDLGSLDAVTSRKGVNIGPLTVNASADIWNDGDATVSVNMSATAGVAVSVSGRLGWSISTWFGTIGKSGYLSGYVHPTLDLSGGFTFGVEKELSKDVPIYAFSAGGFVELGLYAGASVTGSIEASLTAGVTLGGSLGAKCDLDNIIWPSNFRLINNLEYGFYGELGVEAKTEAKMRLFLQAEIDFLGYTAFSADAGGGPYAEISGGINGGFKWTNLQGFHNQSWKVEGSVEIGVGLDSTVELMDGKMEWPVFEWKYPLYEKTWSSEPTPEWKHIPAGALTYIDAAKDGTVVAVHNNAPFMLESDRKTFSPMGSNYPTTKMVTAGSATQIYLLATNGQLYQWNGSSWVTKTGVLNHIDIAASGRMIGVGTNTHFFSWNGSNGWVGLSGTNLQEVAVDENERLYCLTSPQYANVHVWTGSGWGNLLLNMYIVSISAGEGNTLYGVDKWGSVMKITGSQERLLGLTAKQVAYGSDDHIYAIDKDGKFYHWTIE